MSIYRKAAPGQPAPGHDLPKSRECIAYEKARDEYEKYLGCYKCLKANRDHILQQIKDTNYPIEAMWKKWVLGVFCDAEEIDKRIEWFEKEVERKRGMMLTMKGLMNDRS